ncbi:MAG: hypothetical protein KY446_11610 [Proteobacteria bacterium]|nr:hypothetical protein [Pseudomonadota bacterium]
MAEELVRSLTAHNDVVAGVAEEFVASRSAFQEVVAFLAAHAVVAVPAAQRVIVQAADHEIVPGVAIERVAAGIALDIIVAVAAAQDIVAVAAGEPGLVVGEMVREGAVVVDFGVNVVDGKIVGDADAASVAPRAAAYTPVPGGTGPVTNLVLVRNTIAAGFAALEGSLDRLP